MRTPRSKRARASTSPATAGAGAAVVEVGFIPTRAKLIEVAAFLDRVDRHGVAGDFRCVALRAAAALLTDGRGRRARRILEKLSDPTTEPDMVSSGKAALGAWRESLPPPKNGIAAPKNGTTPRKR